MSEALTVLNNNQSALALGGLGLGGGSRLFKLKPATMELVQKTTRQEGAQPGKFRITATNEHFESLRVVLLGEPSEQREYYLKGNDFSKDSKLCFSLDNVTPHARAKDPQGMNCATCPKGDINWKKWYQTKKPEDLPPCRKYWHCVLADRATQMIYYFNVKGTSVSPFEQSMQNLARLFAAIQANVIAQNKKLKADFDNALTARKENDTMPTEPAYVAMPNIFDITFTLYSYQKEKGGPFIVGCKDFAQLKPEDRASFGSLFLDFQERKQSGQVQDQMAAEAEAAEAAVNGPATTPAPQTQEVASVISSAPQGEVLPPEAGQITI